MILERFAIAAQLPGVRGSAPYVAIFIGCKGTSKVGEIVLSHLICSEFSGKQIEGRAMLISGWTLLDLGA